jgi:hypothetical protein
MQGIRKTLLTLLLLVPTSLCPALLPRGQADAPGGLPENAVFARALSAKPEPTNSSSDDNNLRQLAQILADAYGNALMHDTPNADLEANDLLLEDTSIRFSSGVLYEITEGSCQPDDHEATGTSTESICVLDDASIGLRDLSDTLSYAAFQLESLGRSASRADRSTRPGAFVMARVASMEHLYRIVVTLSNIYLDRSQSGVYIETAREQLRLARKNIEIERNLCACPDHDYAARLQEISQLGDQLNDMRDDAARP